MREDDYNWTGGLKWPGIFCDADPKYQQQQDKYGSVDFISCGIVDFQKDNVCHYSCDNKKQSQPEYNEFNPYD